MIRDGVPGFRIWILSNPDHGVKKAPDLGSARLRRYRDDCFSISKIKSILSEKAVHMKLFGSEKAF
jgi:hypothetical protein